MVDTIIYGIVFPQLSTMIFLVYKEMWHKFTLFLYQILVLYDIGKCMV